MEMALRIRIPVLLAISVAIFGVLTTATKEVASKTMGPVFIFGDSTMDVGTNNHLKNCTARADHPYYGVDYPRSKATGRFSNGLNLADTIVALLGGYNCSPLPFLALVEDRSNFSGDILNGVNFASGGAGLAKDIGKEFFKQVISLEEQIQQFDTVRGNITASLGESKGDLLLQESMYIICIGSNDIMAYIFTHPVTPERFIANLTDTYAIHLNNLYNMGARKFGLISIPPIGCCPMARSFSPSGACTKEPNDLARAFYISFESLLQNLSTTLEGFKYSLANTYNMTMSVIERPTGFTDVKSACCGNHTQRGLSDCNEGEFLCTTRDDYLFWDAFHPSQAACKLAASALVFGEGPGVVTPINFNTLRRS